MFGVDDDKVDPGTPDDFCHIRRGYLLKGAQERCA
jgi:hypothetical protein